MPGERTAPQHDCTTRPASDGGGSDASGSGSVAGDRRVWGAGLNPPPLTPPATLIAWPGALIEPFPFVSAAFPEVDRMMRSPPFTVTLPLPFAVTAVPVPAV